MKKVSVFTAMILILVLFSADKAAATCPEGSFWTAAWTDTFGQTTYSLEAPCKVYLGTQFAITAKAKDSVYPNTSVGFGWSVIDNSTTIAGSGFNWLMTVNGQWQKIVQRTYSGDPVNHLIQFKFTDLGQGGGTHGWQKVLLGDVTAATVPNLQATVDAGPDLVIAGVNQNSVFIQGKATDPDGAPLTYRWLEGTTVLQASQPVEPSGAALLSLSSVPPLSTGAYTLTLEVADGNLIVTDTMTVSVNNSPPFAAPYGGGTYQLGEAITVQGSVADYDGDLLSYSWQEGDVVLAAGALSSLAGGTPTPLPPSVLVNGLPLGTHTLTLVVSDGVNTVTADISVAVVDTLAPTLAPSTASTILWPPNGKMREVVISANAHDNSGEPVLLSVMVIDNQPPQADKKGVDTPDVVIDRIDQSQGNIFMHLRAVRSGKIKGDHVYTIVITAVDGSGNTSSATVVIITPHDQGTRL